MVLSHYFLILLKERGQRVFGTNSPEQPCGVTESQGDKHIDVESGAGSAEGGDQGQDGGGGQEEAEADQAQEDGHLVNPGVEHHFSEVDTVCVICPASKFKSIILKSLTIRHLPFYLLLRGFRHHFPSSPQLLTASLEAE